MTTRIFLIVTLAILCFVQNAATKPENFTSDLIDDRIVGGIPVSISNYKYQVAVLTIQGRLCGGSLIRPNWVLTAGHCVEGSVASDFRIRAGSSKFYSGGVSTRAIKVIKHPKYNSRTLNYDVALLKLKESLTKYMSNHPIAAIGLAKKLPQNGAYVSVTGFGLTTPDGSNAKILQKVRLRKIYKPKCNYSYGGSLFPSMFCAGYWEGGKSPCHGDSGGPLVRNGRQIGIVSFGHICAETKFPEVFTSVPYVRKWILSSIKIN